MKHGFSWVCVTLLALSLAISLSTAARVAALRRDLDNWRTAWQADLRQQREQLDHVAAQLWRIEQAGLWASSFREVVSVEKLEEGGPVPVAIAWMLHELPAGARVALAYRASEEQQWREVAATWRGGPEYTATIDLDPRQNWAYCIIVRSAESVRTSDIRQLDLRDKFGAAAAVFAVVERQEEKNQVSLEIRLRQRPEPALPSRRLQGAELFPRTRDGRHLPALAFQPHNAAWTLSCALPRDTVEATVKVRFADGTAAEGLLPLDGRPIPEPLIQPGP